MKQQKVEKNELQLEFLNVNGLNPWVGTISSNRNQMFGSSHISQKLVIKGATERRCQTGLEGELAKYTFSLKMPCDASIIKVVDMYKRSLDKDSIVINPRSVAIYENAHTRELGILNITKFCSYHQYFGFEYKFKSAASQLMPGRTIPKDTIIADSPAVSDEGGYKYGAEMNMAFMSHPSVSEDGIMISSDVLDKFKFKVYETRVVEWGSKKFPLNIYGDAENFKSFPEIGELVRDDGVLMIFRTFDKNLAPIEQSIYDLMEPDYIFDKAIYASGPGGKIIDIKVQHDDNIQSPTPIGMDNQIAKYDKATKQFYQEILDEYKRMRKLRGESLQITPEFNRLLVEALGVLDPGKDQKLNKLYRKNPLDDYRVEFTIEYEVTPSIGFKLTCTAGGKGVICKIADPSEMPVDEHGNRADIVMDANATISRMNIGRLYEQYINSASRDTSNNIRAMLNINEKDKSLHSKIITLADNDPTLFNRVYCYLMGYYSICSAKMFKYFNEEIGPKEKVDHLYSVVKDGIYLYLPTNNEKEHDEMVLEIEKHYKPLYGPVTYRDNNGVTVKTKSNVRIASVYILLLEKTGDDWAAVASGKLHHFGILSQLTKNDKYSQPTRNNAVRSIGETEARIFTSYCGPKLIAELMDRNNSPITHKNIVWNLLTTPKPTDIDNLVDRTKIGFNNSKPLQLVNHIFQIAGIEYKYNYTGIFHKGNT